MRLQLTLKPLEKNSVIPINYQYPIAAAIYKILSCSCEEYATWLHDRGYLSSDGKPMKFFVFSRLSIDEQEQRGNMLIAKNFSLCRLTLSSPMLNDFFNNFLIGLFQNQTFDIGNRETVARFVIKDIEALPPCGLYRPEIRQESIIKFKCLSPIVLSTMQEYQGELRQHYFRPDDPNLSEAIRKNLIHKFHTMTQSYPKDDSLEFILDEQYIQRKGGASKISKLISICEGDESREVKIKSFTCPFFLKGSIELIQCAYECGIGEKNSLGFGMIEMV